MFSDLRFAFRLLGKSPGFTTIVILTLALGIGAVSAIYSLVYSTVIKPLPYPDSERLYYVGEENTAESRGYPVSPATYLQWKEHATHFESLALLGNQGSNISGAGELKRAYAQLTSASLFKLLGVQPLLGRTFREDEDTPGKSNVVVLSHKLWKASFGSDPNVIGQSILINGQSTTIIGVLPASFQFDNRRDIYLPFTFNNASASNYKRRYGCIGRMKAGVTPEQARAQMAVISSQLAQDHPTVYKDFGARFMQMHQALGRRNGEQFYLLLGAVACLLLIACTNIANLLLARSSARQSEMAVRTALGASRGRIIRQLLGESLILALIGGSLGVLFGKWCLNAIVAFLPSNTNRLHEVAMDGHALAITLLITIGTGIIFGLVPAIKASRVDLNSGLKDSGRSGTNSKTTRRLRSSLVVAEICLALILLTGAGLFYRSILKAQNNDIGFETETTYLSVLLLDKDKYPAEEQRVTVVNRFVDAVKQVPGIANITFTNHTTPMTGGPFYGQFSIAGRPKVADNQRPHGFYYGVTEGYFDTLKTPLILGRLFNNRDSFGANPVALINQEMAKTHFANENPLGQLITIHKTNGTDATCEIVGVVGNIRQWSLTQPISPQIYQPYAQTPELSTSLMLRTTGGKLDAKAAIRAFRSVDPDSAITEFYSMERGLSDSLGSFRTSLTIYGIFSSVALLLSFLGIYGVMSYNVSQRTGEIGIRMALGATRPSILKLILGQGSRLTLYGIIFGVIGGIILGRYLESRLYDTTAYDPVTLVSISVILAIASLFACYFPARRATKVDPMVALRTE